MLIYNYSYSEFLYDHKLTRQLPPPLLLPPPPPPPPPLPQKTTTTTIFAQNNLRFVVFGFPVNFLYHFLYTFLFPRIVLSFSFFFFFLHLFISLLFFCVALLALKQTKIRKGGNLLLFCEGKAIFLAHHVFLTLERRN